MMAKRMKTQTQIMTAVMARRSEGMEEWVDWAKEDGTGEPGRLVEVDEGVSVIEDVEARREVVDAGGGAV